MFLDIDPPSFSHELSSFHWGLLVPIFSSLICGVYVEMVFAGVLVFPALIRKGKVWKIMYWKKVWLWLLMNDLKLHLTTSYFFSHMEAQNILRISKSRFLKKLELNIWRCSRWLEKVHLVRCSRFKEKEHRRFMLWKSSATNSLCRVLLKLKRILWQRLCIPLLCSTDTSSRCYFMFLWSYDWFFNTIYLIVNSILVLQSCILVV